MIAPKKILIVGGVAGGASAAARARRLDEQCEIIVLDRGPYVSFANCGLPYYVGDVIKDESKLLIASPQLFRDRFRIDVRVQQEVLSIDRQTKQCRIREVVSAREYTESYDALVLATGARAIQLPIDGVELPNVFALRTIPDSRRLREALQGDSVKHATIVGAGFVGVELAENLVGRGLAVTTVERAPQVMPPLDAELASVLESRLMDHGVEVLCGKSLARISQGRDQRLLVDLDTSTSPLRRKY